MLLKSENKTETALAILLVLSGVLLRLLPHPENFTPVAALALFSGVVLSRRLALTVPLAIMILSDLWIGPHALFLLTWGSFAAVAWLGGLIGRNPRLGRVFLGAFGGSALFFVVTNLGVFLFYETYPKSFAGLLECYVMALPFYRNSLLAALFYTGALFGLFALAKLAARKFSLRAASHSR